MIALFGGADADYPRSRVWIEGLEALGVPWEDLRVPRSLPARRRWTLLARRYRESGPRPDWLLVPEFAHKDLPLACWLARRDRTRIAFDPLISRHDTLVGDWGLYRPGSFEARWNRWLDGWVLGHADRVIADTGENARRYRELGAPAERLVTIPLGAEEAYWRVGEGAEPEGAGELRVLYAGGFLPFHGTGTVLGAAALLARHPEGGAIRFELIGDGIEYPQAVARVRSERLERVELRGRRPLAELPARLAAAHVSLGCFGAGEKADRVVPHKVVQALAAGRCVVTRRSAALGEDLEADRDYVAVPPEDPEALATALLRLARDPGGRRRRAASGRARAAGRRRPVALARALLEALGEPAPAVR